MYFLEWLMWRGAVETPEERAKTERIAKERKLGRIWDGGYEDERERELAESRECVSDTPQLRGPVYVCNDTVLELRCGMFESWRGLVTMFSLMWVWVLGYALQDQALTLILVLARGIPLFAGTSYAREPSISDFLSAALFSSVGLAGLFFYFKYAFRFTRLEALTSRHLLIRFNRKTRQVHLHRPKYCCGIVTLPWEGFISSGSSKEAAESSDVGLPLGIFWHPRSTGLPHQEFAFIGPPAQGYSELRNEWEYIRRFMEDGPAGLPKPELTSHFPWPAQAFKAQLEDVSRFLPNSDSPLMFLGLLLMIPAVICLGAAHWVSLLLCWKPRWPKAIREAGQPGKPVPKLTTIDDYPPDVRERLLANADRWALKPGSRPEKKPRASRKRRAIAETEPEADSE